MLLPDGRKRRVAAGPAFWDSINEILNEWQSYIERNWMVDGKRKPFDPEDKVKYMLDGLANIILRPNMDGLLTDYQKMKIGKYEIPFSSCDSGTNDEVYSARPNVDNGEEQERMAAMINRLAEKYDAAHEAKLPKTKREQKKTRPPHRPTRREKIEAVRRELGITDFTFARVDTENNFVYGGQAYHIDEAAEQYAPRFTGGGEEVYDMDQVLCCVAADGSLSFFDMEIKNISDRVQKTS